MSGVTIVVVVVVVVGASVDCCSMDEGAQQGVEHIGGVVEHGAGEDDVVLQHCKKGAETVVQIQPALNAARHAWQAQITHDHLVRVPPVLLPQRMHLIHARKVSGSI